MIPSMRPEPARDGYGRYLLPDPVTGAVRAYTRATTIAHTLSDQHGLTQWKRRKVAEGLALKPALLPRIADVLEELDAAGEDWRAAKGPKADLDALCDEASNVAGANVGAGLGTALHALTEWYDAGREDEVAVPAELDADLRAYVYGMDDAGIERPAEYIERIVINSQVGAAGTFDRLLRVPGREKLVIGDLKTQKSVDFGFLEIAVQLAEYAYADAIVDPVTGKPGPMPDVDRSVGLVLHLPVGKGRLTIYEVDLEEGWAAAQHAYATRGFRGRSKALGRRWVPPREPASHLTYLIRHAGHPDALTALWRDAGDSWLPEHTAAATARKAELLAATS